MLKRMGTRRPTHVTIYAWACVTTEVVPNTFATTSATCNGACNCPACCMHTLSEDVAELLGTGIRDQLMLLLLLTNVTIYLATLRTHNYRVHKTRLDHNCTPRRRRCYCHLLLMSLYVHIVPTHITRLPTLHTIYAGVCNKPPNTNDQPNPLQSANNQHNDAGPNASHSWININVLVVLCT